MRIAVEDVDYADLLIHLPAACRWIDQAIRGGGVVLVHCYQGLSRSAAVVAAYSELTSLFSLGVYLTGNALHSYVVQTRDCNSGARVRSQW